MTATVPQQKFASIPTDDDEEPGSVPRRRRPALAELKQSVVDVWRVRGLLYELTLRDVRVRYKQAAFGVAWALLSPAFAVLGGLMFRLLMSSATGVDRKTSLAMLAVKAVPWSFFSGSIAFATGTLATNGALLTKVYFPREVLPLSTVVAHLVDFSAGYFAVTVLLVILGVPATPALLWVPVLLLLLVVFTAGAALAVSCANLFYRDVKYAVQIALTFGIFFTPVFYEAGQFGPAVSTALRLNPLTSILEGLRVSIVNGHTLTKPLIDNAGRVMWEPWQLLYAVVAALGLLMISMLLFARLERRFADYV